MDNIEKNLPRVVSREEWLEERRALLVKEKELTRQYDRVSAERRELPWVKVEKNYVFDTPDGKRTLVELFDGRSQLIVYHFMFGPGWKEGCSGCSFVADHIDGANLHLAHHDVTVLAVSRAPLAEFLPFKQRMGWYFTWVSSHGSDFNYDYQVSTASGEETHGLSVFFKNVSGEVFHTYSTYARGVDILLGAHHYLDLTPKGRNEQGTMSWMRHHDRYDEDLRDVS
ncbi:DUF899 domain-containing protein [Halomonas sp. M20]|uniref:DUF899 domain-containing protein n=1 Tax=Halomonas sp. M20 TaxID=2763264 RepID=UPI001D0BC542|nr:thioredoxin family protein [Halomonas sp. M20]